MCLITEPASPKENRRKFREMQQQEIAERRAAVSERYRKGWKLERIAKDIRVDKSTVSRDIHALLAEWERIAGLNVSAHIATELERLNGLQAEAWESFRKSQQPRKVATARRTVTPVEGTN